MLRITDSMVTAKTLANINNNTKRLSEANDRVSSGKKIDEASDDPTVAARAIKYRNYVDKIGQYQDNAEAATSWQKVTDDALDDLDDVVKRLQEITTKAASTATTGETDMEALQQEATELQQQLVDILNTSYAGRYVFAGYDTDEAPYELVQTYTANDVTSVDDTGYTEDSIGGITGLTAGGSYTLTVADSTDYAGAYSYTLTDADGNVVATADNITDTTAAVTLTGTDDESVTLAGTAGVTTGDMTFTVNNSSLGSTITYKGQVLSLCGVVDSSVSDEDIISYYTANASVEYDEASAGEQAIKYNIGYGIEVAVNVEGQDVTGTGADDVNLFDTVAKLLLALDGDTSYKTYNSETGEVETVSFTTDELLTELQTNEDQLLTTRTDLGARMSYTSTVSDRLASDLTTYKEFKSDNEDVDLAEAATEQATAEYVYQASLTVASSIISKTLVDYLA